MKLIQESIGPFGFEVQILQPGVNELFLVKCSKPSAFIVDAETSDKSGFKLCTEIRKLISDQIHIILATKSLSDRELCFHQKQRFHTDLYLDKKFLTPNSFLGDFRKIVTLGARTGVPLKSNPQIAAKRVATIMSGFDDRKTGRTLQAAHRCDRQIQARKGNGSSPQSRQVFLPLRDFPR